jgi:NADPH:quinone reductase-like Zn-dependent oxidoreductase
VYQQARLAPGETFLVHGGAGGIGTFAIQIAKAEGCTVACTAGSAEKLARCRELGADLAISYRDDDFVAAVLKFTGGQGADVILDIMGGPYLAGNLDALALWGRLAVIATRGGSRGEIDLGLMMQKRISMTAATLRTRTGPEKAEVVAATREHIWPLINAGKVVPVIHAVLPMAEAAQAHRLIDDGTHIGKILLAN